MRTQILLCTAALAALSPLPARAASTCNGATPTATNSSGDFPRGTFFTVDLGNRLEQFSLAAPQQRLASLPITGLAAGEDVLGIDFRPANGKLYGIGSSSRLYVIDPLTGAAAPAGIALAPALDGAAFGFDFNPTVDRVRVTSDNEQNLRLHPETGVVTVDGAINPAATLAGSAYRNNFAGATVTTLFAIDAGSGQLMTQSPPNNGALVPVGALGVTFDANAGFDIASDGTAYAALNVPDLSSRLYTLDLTTGLATHVGVIGTTDDVRGFALVVAPEAVFGVDVGNQLVCFDTHVPSRIRTRAQITGLQPGELVFGIDFRPATGELYGLGGSSRIYRIDPVTAVATAVGPGPFTPALTGGEFGFDFNPTVDRLRIVSDAEQNLRVHPDTGALASNDVALAPADTVVAAAYSNNFVGATITVLYDIDAGTDQLLTQAPPNNGQLNLVGPLNVNTGGLTGFDIAPSGLAYASLTAPTTTASQLYRIDLASGGAGIIGNLVGSPLRDVAVRLAAEVVYGITSDAPGSHQLIRFNAAAPTNVVSTLAVTGLQAGEAIVGFDVRPTTGQLYLLGSTSRLYTLDPGDGVATQVGSGVLSPALSGNVFGFDFNPALDRIRVVSDFEQNLVLHPDTAVVTVQSPLSPAGNVAGAAYSSNHAGAVATTLYDVDWGSGTLLQQVPASGAVSVVGALGIAPSNANLGFDIATISQRAYLTAYTGGVNAGLYRVDLATGAATLVAGVGSANTLLDIALRIEVSLAVFGDGFE